MKGQKDAIINSTSCKAYIECLHYRFIHGSLFVKLFSIGEAMEKGLRDCCRSIRIGKILIKFNEESKTPMVMQLIILEHSLS